MRVRDLMTQRIEWCTPDTDLSAAAMIMWRNDCGVVPVVEAGSARAIGVITDRDICMAVATRHLRPEQIQVSEVMSGTLVTVTPDDDLRTALARMSGERVRRLAVVARDGVLEGMLSLNDLILRAEPGHGRARAELGSDDVLGVLKSVCEHRGTPVPAKRVPVAAHL